MTESNQAPNQSPPGSPDYEGADPDLPDREKKTPVLGVSTVQVSASAAASVTSALAASAFGVAGTLIGAAVGSIVSTIAGALYTNYLGRAGERLAATREVVIQRIPGEVIATTPLRHLTRPTDLPGRDSLQPVGDERGDETVTVPVEDATRLLQHPEGMAPLNGTGPQRSPAAAPPSLWKRKPVLAMGAISGAGFLIALGLVLSAETVIGHPVSGGSSGTTFSNLGNNSSKSDDEVTPTESTTVEPTDDADGAATEEPTVAPTEGEQSVPTATTDPTESADGSVPDPADQPTPESTDPGVAATDAAPQGVEESVAP
jgi:hypothetical protein